MAGRIKVNDVLTALVTISRGCFGSNTYIQRGTDYEVVETSRSSIGLPTFTIIGEDGEKYTYDSSAITTESMFVLKQSGKPKEIPFKQVINLQNYDDCGRVKGIKPKDGYDVKIDDLQESGIIGLLVATGRYVRIDEDGSHRGAHVSGKETIIPVKDTLRPALEEVGKTMRTVAIIKELRKVKKTLKRIEKELSK